MGVSQRFLCPKCDAKDACVDHIPAWKPAYPSQSPCYNWHPYPSRKVLREHLYITCRECGYERTVHITKAALAKNRSK